MDPRLDMAGLDGRGGIGVSTEQWAGDLAGREGILSAGLPTGGHRKPGGSRRL